jgi:hypothetical protein
LTALCDDRVEKRDQIFADRNQDIPLCFQFFVSVQFDVREVIDNVPSFGSPRFRPNAVLVKRATVWQCVLAVVEVNTTACALDDSKRARQLHPWWAFGVSVIRTSGEKAAYLGGIIIGALLRSKVSK